jgi:hypothetical protein
VDYSRRVHAECTIEEKGCQVRILAALLILCTAPCFGMGGQVNEDGSTVKNVGVEAPVTVQPKAVNAPVTVTGQKDMFDFRDAVRSAIGFAKGAFQWDVPVTISDSGKLTVAAGAVQAPVTVAPDAVHAPVTITVNNYFQEPLVASGAFVVHGAEVGGVQVTGPTWLMFWLVVGGVALWGIINWIHRHWVAKKLPVARDGGVEIPAVLRPVVWLVNLFL